MKNINKKIIGVVFFFTALSAVVSPVFADCIDPAAPQGSITYGSAGDISAMLACDGSDWVPWAGWTISGYPAPQYSSSGGGGGSSVWAINGTDTYYNAGEVGIGTASPGAALHVIGDIYYTGVTQDVSDIRLKENITPLENSLSKITRLEAFSFTMKDDPNQAVEYGFSAQDVQPIFPELVRTTGPDTDTLSLNYTGLIAPMIEAIKEQQEHIKELEQRIRQLEDIKNTTTTEAP